MKRLLLALLASIMLIGSVYAGDNKNDYRGFFVQKATVLAPAEAGDGNRYYMWLQLGSDQYYVGNQCIYHCFIAKPGDFIRGKIGPGSIKIEFTDRDGKARTNLYYILQKELN